MWIRGILSVALAAPSLFLLSDLSGSGAERAIQAEQFVDSIGVDTHLSYTNTYYCTEWPQIKRLLVELGVRHIRDGAPNMPQWYYDRINGLATEHGIRNIGGCHLKSDLGACVQSMLTSMPGIEGFESLNEFDASGDADWVGKLQAHQADFYTAVKGNPATARLPVIGPSLTNMQSAQKLGDLSASLDVGNLHNYLGGRNPGTWGWGGPYKGFGYGSIQYNLALEALVSGTKPVWTTETGYHWGTKRGGDSPDDINARYITRLFLEQYLAGIQRTYLYQFSAQGPEAGSGEGSGQFGLTGFDMKPKPAFHALKGLIELLGDKGATFTPDSLSLALAGAGKNVHHLLMEKRDRTFYLALWIEAEGFDTNHWQYEAVPGQRVTISLPNKVKKMTDFTFEDSGSYKTSELSHAGGDVAVSVSDQLQVIRISM